ncbi:MAG: hypothetical protein FJW23_12520 [Acidimicrobiia bacterium]|nr:hypothetical protein [Acidimicrobiia bacterium]
MLIVRNCFVARPGHATRLANQLKDTIAAVGMPGARVLTDLTGDFNRVILEYEVDDVAGFEATMKEYQTNPVFREKMQGYTDLWITGSREILQVA